MQVGGARSLQKIFPIRRMVQIVASLLAWSALSLL